MGTFRFLATVWFEAFFSSFCLGKPACLSFNLVYLFVKKVNFFIFEVFASKTPNPIRVPLSKKIKNWKTNMHLFLLVWFRGIQKKIAIHFKVWPQTYFSPNNTLAQCLLQPGNTSARKYFSPEILQPRNTSARNNFGPIHFGQRTKFSKVSF